MQPGGERRFAAKTANLPKQLDENFLRQVFRLDNVAGHAQAERIYAPIVTLVKLLKSAHVAVRRALRQLKVGGLRSVGSVTPRNIRRLCVVRHYCPSLSATDFSLCFSRAITD